MRSSSTKGKRALRKRSIAIVSELPPSCDAQAAPGTSSPFTTGSAIVWTCPMLTTMPWSIPCAHKDICACGASRTGPERPCNWARTSCAHSVEPISSPRRVEVTMKGSPTNKGSSSAHRTGLSPAEMTEKVSVSCPLPVEGELHIILRVRLRKPVSQGRTSQVSSGRTPTMRNGWFGRSRTSTLAPTLRSAPPTAAACKGFSGSAAARQRSASSFWCM
mmetsp:Transcript_1242/g.2329  ORF Transcript_1242/g.2329 Transcript_1242/m.2329 type:complete len:218 (-) Transcript_1242:345-998(-)